MDVYWFGLAVYLQPLIWMYLYDKKIPISPKWIQFVGVGVIATLILTNWSSGHYTNKLLIAYVLMVIFVIYHYRIHSHFQPVCLAFLIVFVNSFFWELPLHVASLFGGGSIDVVLLQALHLSPLPFLMGLGFKPPRHWVGVTLIFWEMVLCLFWLRTMVNNDLLNQAMLYGSRFLGLAVLLWILQFPKREAIA